MNKTTAQKKGTAGGDRARTQTSGKKASRAGGAAARTVKVAKPAGVGKVARTGRTGKAQKAPVQQKKPASVPARPVAVATTPAKPSAVAVRPAAPAAPQRKPVVQRPYDKMDAERAAKAILKSLRPLVGDDDESDAEAQRNRLSLENAHPRRRSDGNYEVFLRYAAGPSVSDPESEAETRARAWFDARSEYPGIMLAVDVTVREDRDG